MNHARGEAFIIATFRRRNLFLLKGYASIWTVRDHAAWTAAASFIASWRGIHAKYEAELLWRQPLRQPQSQRLSSPLVTWIYDSISLSSVSCWPMNSFLPEWNMADVPAVFPCVSSDCAPNVLFFVV